MQKNNEIQKAIKKIEEARKLAVKEQYIEHEIFDMLDELKVNVQVEVEAENASTLEEGICCYIQYGEYSTDKLYDDLKKQITNKGIAKVVGSCESR